MKNKQICYVYGCDGIVSRDKDHLLGEPVNYDQDSVKTGEWWKFFDEVYRNGIP